MKPRITPSSMRHHMFLIGAPKCGTSALHQWLAAHPEVEASEPKETFYFMDEDSPLRRSDGGFYRNGPDGFEAFFPKGGRKRVRVESTTHMIYQADAPSVIDRLWPDSTVVAALRDPVRRMLSAFNFTKHNLARIDRRLTFDVFVDILLSGRESELNRYFRSARSLAVMRNELLNSSYTLHLERWREAVNHRLKVVVFERMVGNPRATLVALADDLGISTESVAPSGHARANETVAVRNLTLHRTMLRLKPRLRNGAVKDLFKRVYHALQRGARMDDASPETRSRLREYFRPFNQRLVREFGLDLTPWEI